jgi:spermidine synthase
MPDQYSPALMPLARSPLRKASPPHTLRATPRQAPSLGIPSALLHAVFFLSGFAAILYQLVWQRSLFTIYGTSIESVTVVVTAFMLGLGTGSLAGGWVSRNPRLPLPVVFGLLELSIGAFGIVSLPIFRWVAGYTSGATGLEIGMITLLVVFAPTLMMGATLPILVAHLVRQSGNVGRSVGTLYFVNTLGSGVGCLLAAAFVLGKLGQALAVELAASLNLIVAACVLGFFWLRGQE